MNMKMIMNLNKRRLVRRKKFCIPVRKKLYNKIVKLESNDHHQKMYNNNLLIEKLNSLINIQKKVKGIKGFVKYNFCLLRAQKSLALISDKQGPDLKSLSQYYNCMNGKMKFQSFLIIIYNFFDIIHSLHKKNLVHLDIKPSNICICNFKEMKQGNVIKFIDHETIRKNGSLKLYDIGTDTYKSLNMSKIRATQDPESCHCFNFSDDFESFFYSIVYIFFGCLPWQTCNSKEEIYNEKRKFKDFILSNNNTHFPTLFKQILEIIKKSYQIDKYDQSIYDNIKGIIISSLEEIKNENNNNNIIHLNRKINFLFEWDIECREDLYQFNKLYKNLEISHDKYKLELEDFENSLER